jgi:hypothetical protein
VAKLKYLRKRKQTQIWLMRKIRTGYIQGMFAIIQLKGISLLPAIKKRKD